jgi:capsular exopolysaccharide synthesis family protein
MELPVAAATDPAATQDHGDPETQVAVLQAYQEALTKDVDRLTEELKTTSQGGLDLEKDREAIAISAEVARKVGAEVEAVSVEQGAPDRVQRLAEAKVPKRRDETKKIKAGGVAALGAFAFALLGVSFWEFLARRVDTPDELVSGLGMKLVGALPALPGRSRRASLADQHWRSVLVESVDATRTLLLHASRLEAVRVVMVTSAVKGEGKTSLSCHLATSLARAGHRTLLVDCDLRSPATHRPFDLPRGPGLCEILRGELEPADVIRETHALGLDLLAAGQGDALALQAIARNGLQPIFKTLEAHYDFIIVDTPPILPVVDSLLIGQNVDGVVFSVMRDVSRLPQVHAAYERLAGLGAKMLGVVVSGVSSDSYRSHYYTVAQTDQ